MQKEWFRGIKAVKDRRLYVVDGDAMFNRPGPRLVDALEWLVSILHTDVIHTDIHKDILHEEVTDVIHTDTDEVPDVKHIHTDALGVGVGVGVGASDSVGVGVGAGVGAGASASTSASASYAALQIRARALQPAGFPYFDHFADKEEGEGTMIANDGLPETSTSSSTTSNSASSVVNKQIEKVEKIEKKIEKREKSKVLTDIEDLHTKACNRGDSTYKDPHTGNLYSI
jgi:hypothetical protein